VRDYTHDTMHQNTSDFLTPCTRLCQQVNLRTMKLVKELIV